MAETIDKNAFEGVVVFTRELNGCLNGVYTNNHPDTTRSVFNESARLNYTHDDITDESNLSGEYTTTWIDLGNSVHEGILNIRITVWGYDVTWTENGQKTYEGRGYRTRENELVVVYSQTP